MPDRFKPLAARTEKDSETVERFIQLADGSFARVVAVVGLDGAALASSGGTTGGATEATLTQVRDAIKAQIDIASTVWTDDTGAYFVRRDLVNEGTGAITVTFTTPAGQAATPGAGLRPLAQADRDVTQALFDTTAAGTGYAAGDILARLLVVNSSATTPTVTAIWVNLSSGAVIAAPTAGTFERADESIAIRSTALTNLDTKTPALGQQTKAGSSPVVIASDQDALPTIAPSLARAISSNTIQRQNNTTAYAAGQVIGGSAVVGVNNNIFTFVGIGRVNGGQVQINRARLYKSQATAAGTFELCLFRASPAVGAAFADAAAFAAQVNLGNAAAASRLVARIPFDMTQALLVADGAELAAIPLSNTPALIQLPANAVDLFGILRATGVYAPLAQESFSVVLEGYAF